jgi:hypothetical protein
MLTTEEVERELIAALKELFIRSNDRVVLKVQALNREYELRGRTLFSEPLTPLPFDGAAILLTYSAQVVREWELLEKGRHTPAGNELDQLGLWHFVNAAKLPKAKP